MKSKDKYMHLVEFNSAIDAFERISGMSAAQALEGEKITKTKIKRPIDEKKTRRG